MPSGVKRTVRLGSMAYVDPDGRTRRADCGSEIEIHPDHVARFDRLNILAGEEAHAPAEAESTTGSPRRRPGRPRKDATD